MTYHTQQCNLKWIDVCVCVCLRDSLHSLWYKLKWDCGFLRLLYLYSTNQDLDAADI